MWEQRERDSLRLYIRLIAVIQQCSFNISILIHSASTNNGLVGSGPIRGHAPYVMEQATEASPAAMPLP